MDMGSIQVAVNPILALSERSKIAGSSKRSLIKCTATLKPCLSRRSQNIKQCKLNPSLSDDVTFSAVASNRQSCREQNAPVIPGT
jgi:hypothetical protein